MSDFPELWFIVKLAQNVCNIYSGTWPLVGHSNTPNKTNHLWLSPARIVFRFVHEYKKYGGSENWHLDRITLYNADGSELRAHSAIT